MKKIFPILLFLLLPIPCFACTPIVALPLVFIGPTMWGFYATLSAYGLLIAVVIKCAVFFWKSDFRNARSIPYIIAANVISTLIGFMIAWSVSFFLVVVIALPISFFLFRATAKMFRKYRFFKEKKPNFVAGSLTGLFFLTIVLFGVAIEIQSSSLFAYWIVKVLFSILGVGFSLLISVVYEESVIASLYLGYKKEQKSFIEPVLWGNVISLLVVIGLAVIRVLPERFASPDFLIGP